jgi:hypothetical protein
MRTRPLVLTVALLALAVAPRRVASAAEAADPAVDAQRSWLALVDAGKYDESFDAAGAFLRNAVTKEHFRQQLKGAREPLGALRSREVDRRQEMTTLPGGPDGKYVVVLWRASFASKASAVETVTVALESDGKWRVIGYYIR